MALRRSAGAVRESGPPTQHWLVGSHSDPTWRRRKQDPPYTEQMRVRQTVLDAIAAHARLESPRECCGLLIGTDTLVMEAVPATNVAADPLRRYEISPVEYLAQIRRCRERGAEGLSVVGAYHSHPRSAPEPSPTDLEQAFRDFLHVIAGPMSDAPTIEVRGYRLIEGTLEAVQLIPD